MATCCAELFVFLKGVLLVSFFVARIRQHEMIENENQQPTIRSRCCSINFDADLAAQHYFNYVISFTLIAPQH